MLKQLFLKNVWLKNLLLSCMVALLAPLIFPFILTSTEGQLVGSGIFKLYIFALLLAYLSFSLAYLLRPKRKRKFKGAKFTQEDLKKLPQEEGTVKWFNVHKGFGFIVRDSGGEVFVHFRSIRGTGNRSLFEGQRVSFVALASAKGMQAEDVCILDNNSQY